jgi:CheY-like chemotaxis protein
VSVARALVVDDAPDIRLLADLVLSMAGFSVTAAASGSEALALLLAGGDLPDIVLLDVQMPHVDGWETLSRLRADPRTAELPVVLCTVKGLPEDTLRGWSLGCDGYLGKPFDISGLVDELNGVLARDRQSRAALRRDRIAELAPGPSPSTPPAPGRSGTAPAAAPDPLTR